MGLTANQLGDLEGTRQDLLNKALIINTAIDVQVILQLMVQKGIVTREEVAEFLHVHLNTVSMLREVGIIDGIKTGKNYMFPQKIIRTFQDDYIGLDVSNKSKAIISKQTVEKRKQEDINKKNYHNAVVGAM